MTDLKTVLQLIERDGKDVALRKLHISARQSTVMTCLWAASAMPCIVFLVVGGIPSYGIFMIVCGMMAAYYATAFDKACETMAFIMVWDALVLSRKKENAND